MACMPIKLDNGAEIHLEDLVFHAVRSQGAGGQNVNKVSSAVVLTFDINASSLPQEDKERLLSCRDRRISSSGIIVIKAQRHRSQTMNRNAACERLSELLHSALARRKARTATRPSRAARQKRLDRKKKRSITKSLRAAVRDHH